MAILKVFCLCLTPKTGSVILGSLGIIWAVMMIVPPCLILESHDFYFREYIKQQKMYGGVDLRDEDIPAIKQFNKVTLVSFVVYLVVFTFASIVMIAGVTARKSVLLIPWLVVCFLSLLFFLIMSISAMFAIASVKALAVLFPAGIPLAFGIYFWFAVYSTFVQVRNEETSKMVRAAIRPEGANAESSAPNAATVVNSASTADTEETDVSGNRESRISGLPVSLSSSSFAQVKGTIQRAIGVTPPPPYEAVAIDIDKEEEAMRSGIERCELALKSKLVPPLSKNSSLDSENTNSDEILSACTTQPLEDRLDPSNDDASLEAAAIVEPLICDSPSITFSTESSADEGSPLETSNVTVHEPISASPEEADGTNTQNSNLEC